MSANHTPLPWAVSTNPGGPGDQPAFPSIQGGPLDPDGFNTIVHCTGDSETVKANCALIVRAVNSYDDLIEVLKDIGQYEGKGGPGTPWRDIVRNLGEKARDALEKAKATGGAA